MLVVPSKFFLTRSSALRFPAFEKTHHFFKKVKQLSEKTEFEGIRTEIILLGGGSCRFSKRFVQHLPIVKV